MAASPEPRHKMAATPEPRRKMAAATPEPSAIMVSTFVPLGLLVEYEGMSWSPDMAPARDQSPEATLSFVQSPEATLSFVPSPEATLSYVPSPEATLSFVQSPEATLSYIPSPEATLSFVQSPEATLSYVPSPEATPSFVPSPEATLPIVPRWISPMSPLQFLYSRLFPEVIIVPVMALTFWAADVNEQFTLVNSRLLSIEDRLAALESKNCVEDTNSKKRRRVHSPKIALPVRHITRQYAGASGNLQTSRSCIAGGSCEAFSSESSEKKEAARSKTEFEDEVGLWKCATIDLMSDEEDGIVDGVSGWIVRPPSFRSQELTERHAAVEIRGDSKVQGNAPQTSAKWTEFRQNAASYLQLRSGKQTFHGAVGFWASQVTIDCVQATVSDHGQRLTVLESHAESLDERMECLETSLAALKD
ncbi:Protein LIAT1 [Anabarilius grahami]|uniref:Protein LIAT1 n=1 Tax=Anabarilius grahami TaxID=495550 RepID=A0A3N0Y8M2_ANAGA|nr:Protein LIAT1 [Anabarilius grahami]